MKFTFKVFLFWIAPVTVNIPILIENIKGYLK